LQAKVQATPHSNLAAQCLSIATETDRLKAVYIRNTCRSSHRHQEAAAKKNEV
jgi:hypothetical protein